MALADNLFDILANCFIEADSTVAGGAPALRVRFTTAANPAETRANTMGDTVLDRLLLAFVATDTTVAGNAPGLRSRAI